MRQGDPLWIVSTLEGVEISTVSLPGNWQPQDRELNWGGGNVKSKSQTCPELFWREGFNIDEKKVNQEGGRAMPHEGP